jgi:CBS domain-containing protein
MPLFLPGALAYFHSSIDEITGFQPWEEIMPSPKKSAGSKAGEPSVAAKVEAAKSATGVAPSRKQAAASSAPRAEKTEKKSSATAADLMRSNIQTCHATDDLATAAQKMWSGDCGALPVVDEHGHACGWVTDRDICMALSMKAARAVDLTVDQVMNAPVSQCAPEDSVKTVLARMSHKQIRRIPVVDAGGRVVGIVSIHDLVRAAKARATATAPAVADVFDTLREIGKPHIVPTV